MKDKLEEKVHEFINVVKVDKNFNFNDEVYFQVLGHELYGYAFGFGRTILFLDTEQIKDVVVDALVEMGAGKKYTIGLIDNAHSVFMKEIDHDILEKLVNIGHDFSLTHDFKKLAETIGNNTIEIKKLI